MCIIAAYFLMSNFPEKKTLLYGENPGEMINFRHYNIIILPNYQLKNFLTGVAAWSLIPTA
ncbi:MAG: hypothetical protein ABR887_02290 [Methanoregulaceae archaeon]|jgi:hypothetical protein